MSQPNPPSPSPQERAPRSLLARLRELGDRLSATDLSPTPEVNSAFSQLVELCVSADDETARDVLAAPEADTLLSSLRELSSRGEAKLERAWARRVIEAATPWDELRRFPYLDNYRDLVRVELSGLAAIGAAPPGTVLVLGSGPLPVTGLLLARDRRTHVVNVDLDPGACELGAGVVTALSLSDAVDTIRADARDIARLPELADADLVVMAALVGEGRTEKRAVAQALARGMRDDAVLLVRSAYRLRTALYPAVSPDDLFGFRPLLEIHPCHEVVNSVLVARPASS